jgi:hypothetical protein
MLQLDSADSFRSGQFKIHDGVNALFSQFENSIHQYRRTQIRRVDETRQRVDSKKEKQEAFNGKENVERTISEDLGDGQGAKLDSSLKLLSEDDRKLLIPGDELEDGEIHMIETTQMGTIQGGTHWLQDYQMQLMLLEQQNKKRLMKARQEQDRIQGYMQDHIQTQFDHMASARELRRRYQMGAIKKQQIQGARTRNPSRDCKATQVASIMPAIGADVGTVPTTKRQKRDHQFRAQLSKADDSDMVDSDVVDGDNFNVAQAGPVEVSHHSLSR